MKIYAILGALAAMATTSACDRSATRDDTADEVSERLFRSSYVRQCITVATGSGVPDADAEPICECTVERVSDGRTKDEVDGMPEEEVNAILNSCIEDHPASSNASSE